MVAVILDYEKEMLKRELINIKQRLNQWENEVDSKTSVTDFRYECLMNAKYEYSGFTRALSCLGIDVDDLLKEDK